MSASDRVANADAALFRHEVVGCAIVLYLAMHRHSTLVTCGLGKWPTNAAVIQSVGRALKCFSHLISKALGQEVTPVNSPRVNTSLPVVHEVPGSDIVPAEPSKSRADQLHK